MPEKIEIKSSGSVSNIFIDGTDISRMCVAADIKLKAGELPQISIECVPQETMTYMVKHETLYSDELIKAATAVLRSELMKHGDLYNGYLASIESALEEKINHAELWENDICIESDKWAKAVMSRIIGED